MFSILDYEAYKGLVTKAKDYNLVIRDYLGCVQADVKVSNLRPDLYSTLRDVMGNELLHFQKQDVCSIEPMTANPPPSATGRFISVIFDQKKPNTVHTFEVSNKHGTRIGLVTYGDDEPIETCLKIYVGLGASSFTVKSLTSGEFIVSFSEITRDLISK